MTYTVINNSPGALRPQAFSQGLCSAIVLLRINVWKVLLLATDIVQVLLQIGHEDTHIQFQRRLRRGAQELLAVIARFRNG